MATRRKKPAAKRKAAAKDTGTPDPEVTEGMAKVDDQDQEEAQVEEYRPSHPTLQNANFDHQGAEEKRQAELAAEREAHNQRTGDASRT